MFVQQHSLGAQAAATWVGHPFFEAVATLFWQTVEY